MRTEYKRDMNHNYLILTGDERIDTDSYQVRMIVANAVPDLLQCRIQGIDGKFMVYYDITSRHSMTALFEEKKMDLESLQVILGGFIQIMEEMSEYLLNPCQLILEPEYIYLDAERKSVRFCYLPGFHGEIQKQFQSLAEYILPKLDHEDGKAVMLGYNVYRRALEDSFHLEYIKEELYKICNSDEEDFSPYEKKKTVLQEENRMTEEEKAEDESKFDRWVQQHLGEKGESVLMGIASFAGVALAIALFLVLPTLLVGGLSRLVPLGGAKTLIEGVLKIAILVGYMAAVSRVKEIHRMFCYHGAEHKTIACYEAGLPLEVENVRKCCRFHPRCGTSFLLIVIVVSILLNSVIPWGSLSLRVVFKLLLLPVVVAVSYEIIKLCGKYDNAVCRAVSAPGLWLQRITTQEPDDSMIECAIAAVTPVLPARPDESVW